MPSLIRPLDSSSAAPAAKGGAPVEGGSASGSAVAPARVPHTSSQCMPVSCHAAEVVPQAPPTGGSRGPQGYTDKLEETAHQMAKFALSHYSRVWALAPWIIF